MKYQFAILSRLRALLAFAALVAALAVPASAQEFTNADRSRGKTMLNVIKKDIQKHYYDPNYHGVDVEATFKAAEAKIDAANSNAEVFALIAQAVGALKDSHTFFLPPARSVSVEYGWQMKMVGDVPYVWAVRPGSDAHAKGLKVGDRIRTLDGYTPTRESMWLMNYFYYSLRPAPGMRLVVESPGGEPRQIDVRARVEQGKRVLDLNDVSNQDLGKLIRDAQKEARLTRHRYYELDEALVWQMPEFFLSKRQIDDIVEKAKGRKALIIDMRGNGGGSEETMLRLIGNLFDHDVEVATVKMREKSEPLKAETRGKDKIYDGKVVVLVDSQSGSAAEVLARVLQIEKRGTVIGDRTAGAVMRSRSRSYGYGSGTVVFYGASITDADVVMKDGKSLEHVGVTPDELLLPKAEEMAAGRDAVLSRAAAIAGFTLDPAKAGAMFPVEWE